MHRWDWNLLTLATLATFCCSAQVNAAERRVDPYEALIAKEFDTAVREDATLKGFSGLPWALDAKVSGLENVQYLKECGAARVRAEGKTLVLTWRSLQVDGCGDAGFFAELKLKKGQIKRVIFVAEQIMVTSADGPTGRNRAQIGLRTRL